MFYSDFSAEPELMSKTPSQKKSNRRKRVSLGRVEKTAKRRFSKGKRSNLRRSSVSTLNLIAEDIVPEATASEVFDEPKCSTRRTKQALKQQSEEAEDLELLSARLQVPEAVTKLTIADYQSAEILVKASPSPGRFATKIAIATTPSSTRRSSVRHTLTLRRSLTGLRHSMTHESVRRASRRSFLKKKARIGSSTCSSNISEDVIMSDGEEVVENTKGVVSEEATTAEEQTQATHTDTSPEVLDKKLLPQSESDGIRFTRSMAQNTPSMVSTIPVNTKDKSSTPCSGSDGSWKKNQSHSILRSRPSSKRKGTDASGDFQIPEKKPSPPKSQTAIRPNMRSFLHTVQKNQMLMVSSSVGWGSVMKSFIKHTTPLKVDAKERERLKLEAVKKKQEQVEERKRKMEEEKMRKREEMKSFVLSQMWKRDERLQKVAEERVKEEQRKKERKNKIEQRIAHIYEKNDQLRVEHLAKEKAKNKVATKRQEQLERRLEDEVMRKKIQQAEEEERHLQEQQAWRRAEEEQERARKLAEARRVHELKKEQEREKDLEGRKQAAGEKERAEWEKALALQREVEKCAREKENRLLEERRKEIQEEKREEQAMLAEEERAAKHREAFKPEHAVMTPVGKGVALNQTVDIEQSPQSYEMTPKGGTKPLVISYDPENYGMDQNSDDSTDDESAPRKPIPSWAEGLSLKQLTMKQYFNPLDLDSYFGEIEEPRLEDIFDKSKPCFFKRTCSAVWNSPPRMGTLPV